MPRPLDEQVTFRITSQDRHRIAELETRGIKRSTIVRVALRMGLAELESEKAAGFLAILAGSAG